MILSKFTDNYYQTGINLEEIQEHGIQFFRKQFFRGLNKLHNAGRCYLWIHFIETFFCCFTEVLAEGSPRPLSSVPDVTHHLVTMQSGRQSYEVSVLTAVNPQEVKPSLALTLVLWRLVGKRIANLVRGSEKFSNFNFLEIETRISYCKLTMSPVLTGS